MSDTEQLERLREQITKRIDFWRNSHAEHAVRNSHAEHAVAVYVVMCELRVILNTIAGEPPERTGGQ